MQSQELISDLVDAHQDYVRALARIVHKKLPARVEFDDLVGYGQIGLLQAAQHFDYTLGVSFETFAYYRIRGSIFDGLRKMSGLPSAAARAVRSEAAIDETAQEAAEQNAQSTEPGQLVEQFRQVVRNLGTVVLLSDLPGEDPPEAVESSTPESLANDRELSRRVMQAIDRLPKDQAELIREIYLNGQSMTDYAVMIGKHKASVSRAHSKAIDALRNLLACTGP